MSAPTLAVIVIARNEEGTIEACLASCLESIRRSQDAGVVGPAEVVLVDSASTDATREIAGRLPVRVIEIPEHWPLSAAAGRYVGLRHTASDLVLFVDGDYVLNPDWLVHGLSHLSDPSVAGVCGVDRENLKGTTAISRYLGQLVERSIPSEAIAETDSIAVGIYRRDWVVRAGGVQPFLKGAEDRDLAIRVRALGGKLLKTRAVMGIHHWAPRGDLNLVEYLRSVSRWSFGEGQAARLAARTPTLRKTFVKRYFNARHLLQLELGLVLCAWGGATAFATLVRGYLAGVASGVFGVLALWWMGRASGDGLIAGLFRIHEPIYAITRLGCFLLGFLRAPRPASEYPDARLVAPEPVIPSIGREPRLDHP